MNEPSEAVKAADKILSYVAHTPTEFLSDANVGDHGPAFQRIIQAALDEDGDALQSQLSQERKSNLAYTDKQDAEILRLESRLEAVEKEREEVATLKQCLFQMQEAAKDLAAQLAQAKDDTARLANLEAIIECISDNEMEVFWNRGEALMNCNDCFFWACSDCEPIKAEDVDEITKAHKECEAVGEYGNGQLLFICRKRKMRPQGALYPYINEKAWPLFDACGEPRPSEFGNPVGTDQIADYAAKKKAMPAPVPAPITPAEHIEKLMKTGAARPESSYERQK